MTTPDPAAPATPPEKKRGGCGLLALIVLAPALFLAIAIARAGVDLAERAPSERVAGLLLTVPALIIVALTVRALRRRSPLVPGLSDPATLFLAGGSVLFIAAVLPSWFGKASRYPQKETMGTMKTLASALEEARGGGGCYPATLDALPPALSRADGWRRPLRYRAVTPAGAACATGYFLVSAGEDGVFQCEDPTRYLKRDTSHFRSDLVLHDGELWAVPLGAQQDGEDDQPACEAGAPVSAPSAPGPFAAQSAP